MTDIRSIAQQFSDKTLPKEQWTHQAHIAAAFAELSLPGTFEQALSRIREKIKTYNIAVGVQNTDDSGYHETLTVFWLTAVNTFNTLHSFEKPEDAYLHFLKTMLAHAKSPLLFYTRPLLFSVEARHHWVQPDILPMTHIQKAGNMEQHFILSDEDFEEQFAQSTLPPALFTHEAHIRLAWLHVSKYGESKAIAHITQQLQQYVRTLGALDKYHETLTVAAIKMVNHFMSKADRHNFYDFITAHPRLKQHFKELIGKHYSFDIFQSEEARRQYISPDLLEFT